MTTNDASDNLLFISIAISTSASDEPDLVEKHTKRWTRTWRGGHVRARARLQSAVWRTYNCQRRKLGQTMAAQDCSRQWYADAPQCSQPATASSRLTAESHGRRLFCCRTPYPADTCDNKINFCQPSRVCPVQNKGYHTRARAHPRTHAPKCCWLPKHRCPVWKPRVVDKVWVRCLVA